MTLSDRGIGVPDDVRSAHVVRRYREVQRLVAEFIGFGAWCDAWAWAALIQAPA